MVAEARQHSERMVGEAREKLRLNAAAKREYEASTGRAKAEQTDSSRTATSRTSARCRGIRNGSVSCRG